MKDIESLKSKFNKLIELKQKMQFTHKRVDTLDFINTSFEVKVGLMENRMSMDELALLCGYKIEE